MGVPEQSLTAQPPGDASHRQKFWLPTREKISLSVLVSSELIVVEVPMPAPALLRRVRMPTSTPVAAGRPSSRTAEALVERLLRLPPRGNTLTALDTTTFRPLEGLPLDLAVFFLATPPRAPDLPLRCALVSIVLYQRARWAKPPDLC